MPIKVLFVCHGNIQYTENILKRPKNNGIEGVRFENCTFFTPLETRKPKRKTRPIEEAGDLKVPCFFGQYCALFGTKHSIIPNKMLTLFGIMVIL